MLSCCIETLFIQYYDILINVFGNISLRNITVSWIWIFFNNVKRNKLWGILSKYEIIGALFSAVQFV